MSPPFPRRSLFVSETKRAPVSVCGATTKRAPSRCGALSRGERQRIGLERASFHDAPFALPVEPTPSLDSLTEASVLEAPSDFRAGKTVVPASRRASTGGHGR